MIYVNPTKVLVQSFAIACAFAITVSCRAQSLDERLDEDAYLRGLVELNLPKVLEHYIATHPAQDAPQAAAFEIARIRMALASPALEAGEREATVERMLKTRAELLEKSPRDARRAIWLADQAAELLFELLPLEASGIAALAGVPSASQSERARRVAREVGTLAAQAETAVAQSVIDLESLPGFATDQKLQEQRRTLTQVERERRIPFLRGVGALLHGWLNLDHDSVARKQSFQAAANALAPLVPTLEGNLATQAKLYLGLAQAKLGEFDGAETLFAQVAGDPDAAPGEIFLARVGGMLNRAQRNGPQAGLDALPSVRERYTAPDQFFFRVLLADQTFLLRRELAASVALDQRDRAVALAFTAYTDLLTAETAVPREALREIVYARLATATDPGAMTEIGDDGPLLVRIARADRLAREESTRAAAIGQLEEMLQAKDLAEADEAAAMFALGRALAEHGQPLFAARRFIELATRFPGDAHAERSVMLGVTLAGQVHESHRDDVEARSALRHGLELVLSRYSNLPEQERWRYAAARLAATERRFDEAMTLLQGVSATSTLNPDALFLRAQVLRDRARGIADSTSRRQAHEESLRAAETAMTAIADAQTSATDPPRSDALRVYEAWLRVFHSGALLELNRASQAVDALGDSASDSTLPPEVQGEAMKLRIAAFGALKKPEEALGEIDRFLKTAPAQAGAVLRPMLEALQRDVMTLVNQAREEEALALAKRTLLPVAERLDALLREPALEGIDTQKAVLGRAIADAYRLGGECGKAERWYEELLETQPEALELLLGQAECHFAAGGEQRLAAAMLTYRRLGAAGPVVNHEAYWLANLRMLQILDLSGRNTQQIKPRIERLRQQDETLGGERFRRGFEILRQKH